MVSYMQDAVNAGVHQLFLIVAQVLRHILRYKHDVALHVHHKEEPIQGLKKTKTWDISIKNANA